MRITSLGAAAAVALLISGAALAQQPMQAQPAQTPPAPAATSEAPVPATPIPPASQEMQSESNQAPQATKVAHQSACQHAIKASEKALDKSQASPETIAAAWQHISTAKQEKGAACKDEAKAAQEML